MFQYVFERPSKFDTKSSVTNSSDWSRSYPSCSRTMTNAERAKRPLPPRPRCDMPAKTSVPLKVWVVASASCFSVCAALVLATLVITKWSTEQGYTKEVFSEQNDRLYKYAQMEASLPKELEDVDNDIPVLEKLPIFKNFIANREKKKMLLEESHIHPLLDADLNQEKKIQKKDSAKLPEFINTEDLPEIPINEANERLKQKISQAIHESELDTPRSLDNSLKNNKNTRVTKKNDIISNSIDKNTVLPEFKPLLPDLKGIKLPDTFIASINEKDYEEYYNDENLYDDYMQSNTMTSYLIEKVQELHDWISSDPDFEKVKNGTKVIGKKTEFRQLLRALNDSLVEGNVTIVMNKLRDIYFGENYTVSGGNKRIILNNSTDMLSFGILTLDVMLLHNIQLMAWENQDTARIKMLKDPEVFAFNALFMDPSKVEAKYNEVTHGNNAFGKRQRQQETEEFDLGKNLFENVLEVGMSAARAAIHLGRAYKNARNLMTQVTNKETANIQPQLSRNIDANNQALNHLQTSYNKNDSLTDVASNGTTYTELDCVWLLYCRNLVATAKLAAPFGTMARINGMALRMLSGELSSDRAMDTMLYEALTGWTDLKCNDMFPRCSKANAASVVLDTILQPIKKSQSTKNGR